ncbi:MAG: hypothetical protein DCO81_07735 [Candidatus Aquiluna sp. XM-24bin5]|jgi:hypothetical protein|nr:MAG: hypothetical protein DCO81_07735 [Candidatus Aquiluna sp. XM-24bin5]
MLENFFNQTANLGTTGALSKQPKRKYQGQTVTDMRQDIITRAEATITALQSYEGGTLRAPMARSIRNGLCVKIGYGKRNVGFFEGEGDQRQAIIPDRHFTKSEAFIAAAYLKKIITFTEQGEFDTLLAQTLRKLQERFEPKNNVHRFAAE